MTTVGQIEKKTQARVVALFQDRLGYGYLGNRIDRDNRNIEPELLTSWLKQQGVSDALISRALHELNRAATDTEMVNGESPFYLGQRYRLRVHEHNSPARVVVRGVASLDLFVRPDTSPEQREAILLRWHRGQLKKLAPPLLEKWQSLLGVEVADWGIRKMKTKWGSCNPSARRVWFNLELAKKPESCLEYIVAHELIHLLERHHNERFTALLDTHVPHWRQYRDMLNRLPLAHEDWAH